MQRIVTQQNLHVDFCMQWAGGGRLRDVLKINKLAPLPGLWSRAGKISKSVKTITLGDWVRLNVKTDIDTKKNDNY